MSSPSTVNTTKNGMMEALLLQQRGPPPIPFKSDCSSKDVTTRDQLVLTTLYLYENSIGVDGAEALKTNTVLTTLYLGDFFGHATG